MEAIVVEISAEKYDVAVNSGLAEFEDLAIYVKPGAMESGMAGAVVTFSVEMPDGTAQRVQAVTSVSNLDAALSLLRGWKDGGWL